GDITERENRDATLVAEQQHCDDTASEASVERHAAIPQLYNLGRVSSEVRKVVKQYVTDTASEDDAKRDPQHEIIKVGDGHRRFTAPQFVGTYEKTGI